MLSAADAALARRDAGLPGLGLVLDDDAMAERLDASLPANVRAVRATYVRYKPATSCVVAYRVATADGDLDAYAKAVRRGAGSKLRKARRDAARVPAVGGPGAMILPDAHTAVRFAPNDADLAVLPRLADAAARRRLLRRLLPARPEIWEGDVVRLRYKPERRYVARVDANDRPLAVLKAYGQAEFARAKAATKAFASSSSVEVVHRWAASSRHRVVAFAWLEGRALDDVLADQGDPEVLAAVGAALAALHRQRSKHMRALGRERAALALLTAARGLTALAPDLGPAVRRLAAELAQTLLGLPDASAGVHGDFSPDQILVHDGRVGVLDLDSVALGDPAGDLGTFVANLIADGPGERLAPRVSALLGGYRDAGGADIQPRLAAYTSAALVRLAAEPFRFRCADWPQHTARLVEQAGAVLREGRGW